MRKDKAKILELKAQIEHLEKELKEAKGKIYEEQAKVACVINFVNQNYLKSSSYQIKGFDYKTDYDSYGFKNYKTPIPVFYKKEN